jgi:hypothetical protein
MLRSGYNSITTLTECGWGLAAYQNALIASANLYLSVISGFTFSLPVIELAFISRFDFSLSDILLQVTSNNNSKSQSLPVTIFPLVWPRLFRPVGYFIQLFFYKHFGFEQIFFIRSIPDISMEGTGHRIVNVFTRATEFTDKLKTDMLQFQCQ